MTIHGERTIRRNGKWAKITHVARARYVIAQGWQGDVAARHIHRLSNVSDAMSWANSWLDD